jgi:hypothetical protein
MLTKRLMLALWLVAGVAVACDTRGLSYGDANSIIAVMSPELWSEVSETVYGEIEQTIVTVRDEKAFTVTYQEPYAEFWTNLRRFRQMLLVGSLSDPWIQEALERSGQEITTPGLHQVRNVWSMDQTVTLVIGPEGGVGDELVEELPAIHAMMDAEYRDYVHERMYLSGVD